MQITSVFDSIKSFDIKIKLIYCLLQVLWGLNNDSQRHVYEEGLLTLLMHLCAGHFKPRNVEKGEKQSIITRRWWLSFKISIFGKCNL